MGRTRPSEGKAWRLRPQAEAEQMLAAAMLIPTPWFRWNKIDEQYLAERAMTGAGAAGR